MKGHGVDVDPMAHHEGAPVVVADEPSAVNQRPGATLFVEGASEILDLDGPFRAVGMCRLEVDETPS